tara:strand:- start:1551 stop:2180 length:630 start_codon:yes stop_codon:yes gene_type:complete
MGSRAEKLLSLLYPFISRITRGAPLSHYPALYWPYARWFKTGPHPDLVPWSLPNPDTQLVIEAPGSCANHSLAVYMLAHNPAIRLATLTHSAAPVRYAAAHGIPCLVLVRDEPGFIRSSTMRFPHLYTRRTAARIYRSFYRSVETVKHHPVMARFEEVTANPCSVIAAVNARFGTDFNVGDGQLPHIRGTATDPDAGYPGSPVRPSGRR